jgi:hypothetical protein
MPRSRRVDGFETRVRRFVGRATRPVTTRLARRPHRFRRVLPLLPVDARWLCPTYEGSGDRTDTPSRLRTRTRRPPRRQRARLDDELGITSRPCWPDTTSAAASRKPSPAAHQTRALTRRLPPLPASASASSPPRPSENSGYQAFHQLGLMEQLLDGDADAIRH